MEFQAFLSLLWIDIQNSSQKNSSFPKFPKLHFWTVNAIWQGAGKNNKLCRKSVNYTKKHMMCGGLMVSVLNSGMSGPGLSPGWGHSVFILGTTEKLWNEKQFKVLHTTQALLGYHIEAPSDRNFLQIKYRNCLFQNIFFSESDFSTTLAHFFKPILKMFCNFYCNWIW